MWPGVFVAVPLAVYPTYSPFLHPLKFITILLQVWFHIGKQYSRCECTKATYTLFFASLLQPYMDLLKRLRMWFALAAALEMQSDQHSLRVIFAPRLRDWVNPLKRCSTNQVEPSENEFTDLFYTNQGVVTRKIHTIFQNSNSYNKYTWCQILIMISHFQSRFQPKVYKIAKSEQSFDTNTATTILTTRHLVYYTT